MRSYLLGFLDEYKAAAVEESYFTDREFFRLVQQVETGLIEDYLAGRLSDAERDRFEARYLTLPELRRRVDEIRSKPSRLGPSAFTIRHPWRLSLAFGTLAVLATFTVRIVAPDAPLPPAPKEAPVLAVLTLSPGISKGPGSAADPKIAPVQKGGKVRLLLELPGQRIPVLCSAQVSLSTSTGGWKRAWFSPDLVLSTEVKGNQYVSLLVDSEVLSRGDYLVEIVGVDSSTRESYTFRVSPL